MDSPTPNPIVTVLRVMSGLAIVGAALCWSAGNWGWLWAWAFTGLSGVGLIVLAFTLAKRDPALFAKRQSSPFTPDQPLWDKLMIIMIFVVNAVWLVFPGLDHRFSILQLPVWTQWAGAVLVLPSIWIMAAALLHNANLAQNVEVKGDAQLATDGPYSVVRHPYYAGFILFYLAGALMLGSGLTLLWVIAIFAVFAARTVGEERVLHEGFQDYAEYRRKVPARLIPLVF